MRGVPKTPLNHQFSAYFTKILWTKHKSLKCSEKNHEQTKLTRQKTEVKEQQQQQLVVHLLELIRQKELWTNKEDKR